MKTVLAIINLIGLIGAIIWYLTSPNWEPAVTSIVLLGALIAQALTNEGLKSKLKLSQNNDGASHNYQASGNLSVTDRKTIQNVKEGSQLFHADTINLHAGIDEKRAREIYQEMNLQLRSDYSKEALEIACIRVSEFENRLMPKMDEVEGALQAFADPSFQILLREAQKTAAASERAADYDLLSELLIHRFKSGDNRTVRAGISRAVEIVDEISDEALLGLTVFHSVSSFFPRTGDINEGLDLLNELFGRLLYGSLPTGNEWLDHLDILNAARLNTLISLKKINVYIPEILSGYTDSGIEKTSDNFNKATEILSSKDLPQAILVDHALNPNFVRLNIINRDQIKTLNLIERARINDNPVKYSTPLSEEQVNAVDSIYDLYNQDSQVREQNLKSFMNAWNKRPNLKAIGEWWDNMTYAIQITTVGKVLAHSNAQRCDKNLPPLE